KSSQKKFGDQSSGETAVAREPRWDPQHIWGWGVALGDKIVSVSGSSYQFSHGSRAATARSSISMAISAFLYLISNQTNKLTVIENKRPPQGHHSHLVIGFLGASRTFRAYVLHTRVIEAQRVSLDTMSQKMFLVREDRFSAGRAFAQVVSQRTTA